MPDRVADCLDLATKRGKLDRKKLDEAVGILKRQKDVHLAAGLTESLDSHLTKFAQTKADQARRNAALKARQTAQSILMRDRLSERVKTWREAGLDESDALVADLVGTPRGIKEGRNSVSSLRMAIEARFSGPIKKALKERPHIARLISWPHLSPARRAEAKRFLDAVATEMGELKEGGKTGITRDEDAVYFAKVLSDAANQIRIAMNMAGADIGEIKGWVPQSHDILKMLRAGKEKWKASILPLLDQKRTFPNLSDPAHIDLMLDRYFDNIVLGKPLDEDTANIPPALKNVASKFEQSRYIHFQDADARIQYNEQFGRGNVVQATVDHIMKQSRALSVMQRYGTRPRLVIRAALRKIETEIDENIGLSIEEKRRRKEALKTDIYGRDGKIGVALAEVMGETLQAQNLSWAGIWAGARAWTSMNKLGMATISALADLPNIAVNLRFQGRGLLDSWGQSVSVLFSRKTTAEQREMSYLFDAFLDGVLGDISSRWNADDGLPGKMSGAMNFFFKVSGLTAWTDNLQAGVARLYSADMGLQAAKAWGELDEAYRHVLGMHGIDQKTWYFVQKMAKQGPDGKTYVIPESARDISGLSPRQTEELELTLLRYFGDETRYAVINGDDRTRMTMVAGTKAGTVKGEILRFLMQFKAFPINYLQRVWGRTIYGKPERATRSFWRNVKDPAVIGDISFLIAQATVFGYFSMVAKQLLKGQKPAMPTTPGQAAEIFTRAFVQGGGAGIAGDFIMGKYSRFGRTLAETVPGPFITGTASDVMTLWSDLRSGDLKAGDALKTAIDNTPYVNLWYTRMALDYLVLYHLQEMMSPGVLARRERRMKKQMNQEYIVPPSQVVPYGG